MLLGCLPHGGRMTAGWVGGLISYHVIKHWEYSGEQGRSGLCSPGSHIPVKVREWWFKTEKMIVI